MPKPPLPLCIERECRGYRVWGTRHEALCRGVGCPHIPSLRRRRRRENKKIKY